MIKMHFNIRLMIALCAPVLMSTSWLYAATPTLNLSEQTKAKQASNHPTQQMVLHTEWLKQLMMALYAAHPEELTKSTTVSADEMVQWVFEGPFNWKFDAIRKKQHIEAIRMAFDENTTADRVLSLITGLYTMTARAYGQGTPCPYPCRARPQALYRAARNLELVSSYLTASNWHENRSDRATSLHNQNIIGIDILLRMIAVLDEDASALAVQSNSSLTKESIDTAHPVLFDF